MNFDELKDFAKRGVKAQGAVNGILGGNERLKELAVKSAAHLLEKLNDWTTEDIAHAITRYDCGSPFDQGIAQFLRLYLAARTIGTVTKR
jgi:hypothetical protein